MSIVVPSAGELLNDTAKKSQYLELARENGFTDVIGGEMEENGLAHALRSVHIISC